MKSPGRRWLGCRKNRSFRKSNASQLTFEDLERRELLVGNPLASLASTVPTSGDPIPLQLDLTSDTAAVIGFHVEATSGSSLDPAAVEIRNAVGSVVPLLGQVDDVVPGNDSLTTASLPAGSYVINVRGEDDSAGDFNIDIFLVGDNNGDGSVEPAEMTVAQAAWASSQFSRSRFGARVLDQYSDAISATLADGSSDANMDGQINQTDLQAIVSNSTNGSIEVKLVGDNQAPTITGGITPDTGLYDNDGITNNTNAAIEADVSDVSTIVSLRGGIDGTATAQFVNLLGDFDASTGKLKLSRARLEEIAGTTLLNNGSHTLKLIAKDEFGNTTTPVSIAFKYDTIAPNKPTQFALDAGSDSGTAGDKITNDNTPTFDANIETGTALQLFSDQVGSGNTVIGQAIASSSVSSTTDTLVDGQHEITAIATDLAGNSSSATDPITIVIDTVAPANLDFDLDPSASLTDSNNNPLTSDAIVSISGDSDEQAKITLTNASTGDSVTGDSASDGSFDFDDIDLDFGTNQITVTATDTAGNKSVRIKTVTRDDAPKLDSNLPDITLTEDEQDRQIDLSSYFSDINTAAGDKLTYTITGGDSSLVAVDINDSTATFDAKQNAVGQTEITVRATDQFGLFVEDTLTIEVTAVNDAPTVIVPATVGTQVDVKVDINGVSIADVDAANADVDVTVTATSGTFSLGELSGLDFSNGQGDGTDDTVAQFRGTIAEVNAALGKLSFTGNSGFTGDATLKIEVDDLGNTGAGGNKTGQNDLTIAIREGNTPPVVDLNGSEAGTGFNAFFIPSGGPVAVVDTDMTVTDADTGTNLVRAIIKIENAQDISGNNLLEFLSVDTSGTNLNAQYDSGTGRLIVEGDASPADYQKVLATLTYNNTAASPDEVDRNISVLVNDGEDNSLIATATVDINDAPLLDNSLDVTLTAINEDATNNTGDAVSSLITNAITDSNPNSLEGIAVIATNVGDGGTWQYSLDNSQTWNNIGTINSNSALLLRPTDRVRFVPDVEDATTASLTYRAWDQTTGTVGTKVSTGGGGGTSAFSGANETATINVTAVNDAPAFNVIESLDPVTEVTVGAGTTKHLALDSLDNDLGDAVSYSVQVTSGDTSLFTPSILDNNDNRSWRITIEDNSEIEGGVMVFQFFEEMVPLVTSEIIKLTNQGAYNSNLFSRVIDDFVIQGGNLSSTSFTAPKFNDQFNTQLLHLGPGYLSMANQGDVNIVEFGDTSKIIDLTSADDTNGSEYFITLDDTRFLDGNHSVFGFQVEGQALRDRIASVATSNTDAPQTNVVQKKVEVFTDVLNGTLALKAAAGASGTAEITITATDSSGATTQRVIDVTVADDTANIAPFLNSVPDVVSTPQNTAATFSVTAIDGEGDAYKIDAFARATVNFDNTGSEAGVTSAGKTTFTHKGSTWSGGKVYRPMVNNPFNSNLAQVLAADALGSVDSQVYLVNSGTAEVSFATTVDSVNFFFGHGRGVVAGKATAFDVDGNVLAVVDSNELTSFADANNFESFNVAGIKRIEFTSGIVDQFDYTKYDLALTTDNQDGTGNAQITVTPPTDFVGELEVLVRVKPKDTAITDTASLVDTHVVKIKVNSALQANLQNASMPISSPGTLDNAEIQSALDAATSQWRIAAGLDFDAPIRFKVRDLGGTALAMTQKLDDGSALITLDDDGAGFGWYTGTEAPNANDGFDLQTVLLHEVGHVHDLAHAQLADSDGDAHVMDAELSPGKRLSLTDWNTDKLHDLGLADLLHDAELSWMEL